MSITKITGSQNVRDFLISIEREGFSEYMINYMYWEKSKYVEKECDDWSVLENLGGTKIETKQNESEQKTLKEIN